MADLQYIEPNRIAERLATVAARRDVDLAQFRANLKKITLCTVPVLVVTAAIFPQSAFWLICGGLITWGSARAGGEGAIRLECAEDPIEVAGVHGELAVLDELERLPDEYVVLNQILLPDSRSSVGYREIDYVVVGPNGVFVLEAKSYNGYLTGTEGDQEWTMLKIGAGGMPYTSSCRNPAKQVRVYIRLLGEALKARGVRVWLNGVVVFSQDNDLSGISVQSVGVVPISAMVEYLVGFRGQRVKDPMAVVMAIREVSEVVKVDIAQD